MTGELLMAKYQDLSKTFAESVQLQTKYVSECCAFSNVFFSQIAAYLEWPKDQMTFAPAERAQTEEPICSHHAVQLRDDGNIHFFPQLLFNLKTLGCFYVFQVDSSKGGFK